MRRNVIVILSAGVLAGCATRMPPPRIVVHHPTHPAAPRREAAEPDAKPANAAFKPPAPTPKPQGPGSQVPLEGFRPMHTQTQPGA